MQIDLEPFGDRVILQRIDDAEEMKYGLHIPDIAQVKSSKGRVVAVGEGRWTPSGGLIPLPVEVGDIVLFSKYGATEISLDGEEFLMLRFDEIFLRQKKVAVVHTIT